MHIKCTASKSADSAASLYINSKLSNDHRLHSLCVADVSLIHINMILTGIRFDFSVVQKHQKYIFQTHRVWAFSERNKQLLHKLIIRTDNKNYQNIKL